MEEKKFIRKVLTEKDLAWTNGMGVKGVKCWYVIHTDQGGYTEDEVEFILYKDGSLHIGSENERYSITLHSEQIDVLREFLKS